MAFLKRITGQPESPPEDEQSQAPASQGPVRIFIAAQFPDAHVLLSELPPGNNRGLAVLGITQDCATLYRDATSADASIVILSHAISNFDVEIIQRLRHYEKHPIVVIALVADGTWATTMERAGAGAHLMAPATHEAVEQLVAIAPGLIQAAYQERTSSTYIPQLDAQTAAAISRSGYQKRTVASYSPKGGSGKTTLATNLSMLLGVVANRPTLLADLNMNGGHVALHLDLREHDRSIYTLAREFKSKNQPLTPTMLKSHIVRKAGSLDVLCGIDRMEMAGLEYLRQEQGEEFVSQLLQTARGMYDFVILDMGSSYNVALHRRALCIADLILMLVTSDAASIEDARKAIETMKAFMDISSNNFQMVVNFWTDDAGLKESDIANYVKLYLFGVIPLETTGDMIHCINIGKPYVAAFYRDAKRRREDPVLRALVQISASIYPPLQTIFETGLTGGTEGKKPGVLRGLLGI